MYAKSLRRTLPTLAVTVLATLSLVPAGAGPLDRPSISPKADEGMSIDPNGGFAQADNGMSIDPNGGFPTRIRG